MRPVAVVSLADFTPDFIPRDDTGAPGASVGAIPLPTDQVVTNPLNKRTEVDEDPEELDAMADTIREHGILQPLIVVTTAAFTAAYPDQADALGGARWVTLIGNRRLVAARLAGQPTVPGIVNDDQTGSMFEVMLVENGNRRDLAPLREAEAMAQVLEHGGISQRELARRIGRTHPYVVQRLALLGLIPTLRAALDARALSIERARQLGSLPVETQQGIADAGPPYRDVGGNAVTTRPHRPSLPTGDLAAAARTIRETYSGEQLAELVRLLSTEPAGAAGSGPDSAQEVAAEPPPETLPQDRRGFDNSSASDDDTGADAGAAALSVADDCVQTVR